MKYFKNIILIQLSLLMVLSTFTINVDAHYCGDFLVDVSVLGKADGCGMEVTANTTKKGCCSNESQQIVGQDDLIVNAIDLPSFHPETFVALPFYFSDEKSVVQKSKKELIFEDFSPPDIYVNFQTAYQVFII